MRVKKFIYSIAFLVLVFKSNAQESNVLQDSLQQANNALQQKVDAQKKKDDLAKQYSKNNVKINLSSLVLNNYSFYYERMVARKIGVAAGYRFMPTTNLGQTNLTKKIIKTLGDNGGQLQEDLNKIMASNNAITLDVRFYMGHKPGARGTYFSLMGRYTNFEMNYPYDYSPVNTTKNYTVPLNGKFHFIGGGIGLGHQWLIAKRIVLDLYLIGGMYGKLNGNLNAVTDLSSMTAQEKIDFENDLETTFTINNKSYLNATVTNSGVDGKINGPFAGIRALGLSVGFAF